MKTSDFYYDLPQELIAQDPLEDSKRGTAAGRKGEQYKDKFFETYEPRYPDTFKWNYWDDQYIRALLWR